MKITKILLLGVIIFLVSMNWISKEDFLNNLKGEIVYVHRDDSISNVYKISANGKNKQLLYQHNIDKGNKNCLFPR